MKTMSQIWPIAHLHQVIIGMQPGFAQRPNIENVGIPQLRTNNISPQGNIDPTDLINVSISSTELKKYAVRKGDVIFNNTNSVEWVGKTAFFDIEGDYVLSNHMTRIRVDTSLLDPEFLARYLHYLWQTGRSGSRAKQWVNQAAIDQTMLAQFEIPLPSLSEQRGIVAILRQADKLRQLRREADKKAQRLLLALFYEMFGSSGIWQQTTTLEKLVDFVGGGTPSRKIGEYFTGDIPWATSKDIKARYLDDAQEHITEKAIHDSATNLVPAGTILLVVKSKILLHTLPISITTRSFCFGQDIKGLIPKRGVEPQFIVASLLAQEDNILKSARGVNTEGLTLEILREIPVPQADSFQRKLFIERMNVYDRVEKAYMATNKHLDTLFQSLLAQAFTGNLTALWREEHEGLKAVNMSYMSSVNALEVSSTLHVDSHVHVEDTLRPSDSVSIKSIPRPGVYNDLSEVQWKVFDLVNSSKSYCTVETLRASSDLPLYVIRQELQLLTQIGLIQAVQLPDRPIRNVVYVPAYRGLIETDRARELDLDRLQKELEKGMMS